ncbi:MAG: hypothetical protein QXX84_07300 [Sulfolobales archaeon]|nr:hypothetical protein [Sulfolobales archaeon]
MGGLNKTRMWGSPHSYEPEQSYEGELWVGVTPNGWGPRIRAPMKGALRSRKPREERLMQKPTAMKPEPLHGLHTTLPKRSRRSPKRA